MPQFARHLSLLLALVLTAGCAGLQAQPDTLRMLVQFRQPVHEPAAPSLIQGLERDTGTQVHYLQTVGEGIHVYQLEGPSEVLNRAAARLSERSDIRFAQPDRRMRPLEGTRAGG